jgi:ubiquinone/menaquinone biosynthesis C-methylase UbiE
VSGGLAEAYDAAAASWSTVPARIYGTLAERALRCSPVPLIGRVVLDVGTGTGVAADAIAAAGAIAVATDLSLGMLRLRQHERPPAARAAVEALPFADRSFGGVMASFVLNHLDDPAAALRETARVTARGGPIIATSYAADDEHPAKAAVQQALIETGWEPEPWYAHLRAVIAPKLATVALCESAMGAAGLTGEVVALRVAFPDLSTTDLVDWRLGMAQHARHLATLDASALSDLRLRSLEILGADHPTLERSILVIAAAA